MKIEVAKRGKFPRLYVNIGVEASLMGAWLAKICKKIMADNPWSTDYSNVLFIPSASYSDLKRAFDTIRHPTRPFTMLLFSDDSTAAFQTPTGVHYADLDISGCDKSHGNSLFKLLFHITPSYLHPELKFVLDQLRGILQIRSPDDWRIKIKLIPKFFTLYSGSVLTTLINNLANLVIAWSIAEHRATTALQVQTAAGAVGYILTVKPAPTIHQVQFLKHSPVYDRSGELQPVLNVGVFLRAIGVCSRDLPGSGDLTARARAHAAAIALCSWPNTNFPWIESFRSRFGAPCELTRTQYWKDHPDRSPTWPLLFFDNEQIMARYKYKPDGSLYTQGWNQLQLFFEHAPVASITAGPDIAHVLNVDYDMTTLHYIEAKWTFPRIN